MESEAGKAAADALRNWLKDKDLAGLRDQEDLAKLPAEEQEACRQFWAEVNKQLSRLETGK